MDQSTPWLENKRWRDNQIRSNAKATIWFYWGFAISWNLVTSPILFNFDQLSREVEAPFLLLILLFPIVGLGLLFMAYRKTIEWKRFGPTPLMLSPFPGSISGEVGGTITINYPLPKDTTFKIVLTNLYTYERRGSDNNSETHHDIVWQDSQQVLPYNKLGSSEVSFCFSVPEDCHATQTHSSRGYHHWTLEIESIQPSIKLHRNYDIPVYQLPEPQRSTVKTNIVKSDLRNSEFVKSLPNEQGLEMHYPLFRNLKISLPFTIFGSCFAISGIFILQADMELMLGIMFSLIGGIIALIGIYMLGLAYRVKVDMQGIHMDKQWFFWHWQRFFPIDKINGFKKLSNSQYTSGGTVRALYTIELIDHRDKSITIGDSVPSASEADQLIAQIEAALNGATLENYSE